ncbi:hypothetical protein MKW92_051186, partial [Papaver armeniacum]
MCSKLFHACLSNLFRGAGHYHSLAVTSHGDVWSWERNNEFQLGRASFAIS